MRNRQTIKINSGNIRAMLRGFGLPVDDKSDAEVIAVLSLHFQEFLAMKEAVRQVLVFANRFDHEAGKKR